MKLIHPSRIHRSDGIISIEGSEPKVVGVTKRKRVASDLDDEVNTTPSLKTTKLDPEIKISKAESKGESALQTKKEREKQKQKQKQKKKTKKKTKKKKNKKPKSNN